MKLNHPASYVCATLLAILASMLLAGCGSSANPTALTTKNAKTGTLKFTIRWPARTRSLSRLIPVGANSINVIVNSADGKQLLGTTLLARPLPPGTAPADPASTTTATLPNLPAGSVQIVASAYPNADGTGTVQASGALTATVVGQQVTTTPPLTMNSAIDHIAITPSIISVALNATLALTASALDASGAVVLVDPGKFSFTVSDTSIATVTPQRNPSSAQTGVAAITGVKLGITTLTVADAESGKSSGAQVTVIPAALPTSIFIADRGNTRIVGLDTLPATTFATFDDSASGNPLYNPQSVALDSQGRIYIADYPKDIVRVDDLMGKNRIAYTPVSAPSAIYVDKAGHIFYRDDNGALNRMDDMTGANLVTYGGYNTPGGNPIGNCVGIAVDSKNRIYVFDGDSKVIRFDDMTGANLVKFGRSGSGVNQFNGSYTGNIAIDSSDRIYVTDAGNLRIVRFDDMTGTNWTTYTIPGLSVLPIYTMFAFATVDSSANPHIYFTNGKDYVSRIDDMSGTNLVQYGTTGSGTGQFKSPGWIAVK